MRGTLPGHGIFLLLAIPCIFLVPESPRWLISKDKISEARKTLADRHAQGNLDNLLVLEQLSHIQAIATAEIEAEKDASYAKMFRTPGTLMVTWTSCIVAVILNTFVNPIAIDGIGWKYYIVHIALLVAWLLIIFFWYPETRGLSLDIVVRFDGEGVIPNGSGEAMARAHMLKRRRRSNPPPTLVASLCVLMYFGCKNDLGSVTGSYFIHLVHSDLSDGMLSISQVLYS
jgi:hypothetical protein